MPWLPDTLLRRLVRLCGMMTERVSESEDLQIFGTTLSKLEASKNTHLYVISRRFPSRLFVLSNLHPRRTQTESNLCVYPYNLLSITTYPWIYHLATQSPQTNTDFQTLLVRRLVQTFSVQNFAEDHLQKQNPDLSDFAGHLDVANVDPPHAIPEPSIPGKIYR